MSVKAVWEFEALNLVWICLSARYEMQLSDVVASCGIQASPLCAAHGLVGMAVLDRVDCRLFIFR